MVRIRTWPRWLGLRRGLRPARCLVRSGPQSAPSLAELPGRMLEGLRQIKAGRQEGNRERQSRRQGRAVGRKENQRRGQARDGEVYQENVAGEAQAVKWPRPM